MAITPTYERTTERLNESLISKINATKPKQIGEKMINSGRTYLNALIYLADAIILIWAFISGQRKEVYTGVYA